MNQNALVQESPTSNMGEMESKNPSRYAWLALAFWVLGLVLGFAARQSVGSSGAGALGAAFGWAALIYGIGIFPAVGFTIASWTREEPMSPLPVLLLAIYILMFLMKV